MLRCSPTRNCSINSDCRLFDSKPGVCSVAVLIPCAVLRQRQCFGAKLAPPADEVYSSCPRVDWGSGSGVLPHSTASSTRPWIAASDSTSCLPPNFRTTPADHSETRAGTVRAARCWPVALDANILSRIPAWRASVAAWASDRARWASDSRRPHSATAGRTLHLGWASGALGEGRHAPGESHRPP